MKRSRRQGSPRILKTDLPSLLFSWLKGVWGSLRRFVMRLLRPNQGRRKYIELKPEKPHTLPLIGVEKLGKVESLTVGDLIGKVRWNPSGQTFEDSWDSIPVATKARSSDRITPLVGIAQIDYAESVSVSDLMETVLWRFPGRVVEKLADFNTDSSGSNVASVEELLSPKDPIRPLICPLMGLEELSLSETLTVGSLMASVQWSTIKKAAKSSPKTSSDSDLSFIQDEINWD